MCTAISFNMNKHYFGRNLDVECDYSPSIVVIPRNFLLKFKHTENMLNHYAIIGVAKVENSYPLMFDGTNEMGLSIAGLRFSENCVYYKKRDDLVNISSYELILWILSICKTTKEAEELLKNTNIVDDNFSDNLPTQPLHWIISDKNRSITVETLSSGMKIYENPVGVLTNNPCFDMQLFLLNNYQALSSKAPLNSFSKEIKFNNYSRGLGCLGLPGDFSSSSRFVRAVFLKYNSVITKDKTADLSQFFHILDSVAQINGATQIAEGVFEKTEYSSCCDTDDGIYYYKTYNNMRITSVSMRNENIDGCELMIYNIIKKLDIKYQN